MLPIVMGQTLSMGSYPVKDLLPVMVSPKESVGDEQFVVRRWFERRRLLKPRKSVVPRRPRGSSDLRRATLLGHTADDVIPVGTIGLETPLPGDLIGE